MNTQVIEAAGMDYRTLNAAVRRTLEESGPDVELEIRGVCGQRYIGDALETEARLRIVGTPGQNLGAFMRGPRIRVAGNAQDGVGNTMDAGQIEIDGHAGDVLGYAMRGGRILVRGDVGYRVGIHMKAYAERLPVIVIGGKAGAFLGEYMAGGLIVLLGIDSQYSEAPLFGMRLGTGMHGGRIVLRAAADEVVLRGGARPGEPEELGEDDRADVEEAVRAWADAFGRDAGEVLDGPFCCLRPASGRPYGHLYTGAD